VTIHDQTSALRRVYVRPPVEQDLEAWRAYGWHRPPDAARADDEHAAFRAALEEVGAEVVVAAAPTPGDPDAIYAYDPVLLTDQGAILLRPGKPGRRGEPEAVATDLTAAGIPVRGRIEAPGTVEGGDAFWLDARTLLVGLGYRTNGGGVEQLRDLLGSDVDVVAFDLPHFRGAGECLHLLSFVSPLDVDLVVGFLPMMPVRLVELLRTRGVSVVEVPAEELATLGPNVLALAPRVALATEGSTETRRRMEAAGVDVRLYAGAEISKNGDGGPTCLTRPLARG
jgi:N-dimethylarginine dimethylaminohydrolase